MYNNKSKDFFPIKMNVLPTAEYVNNGLIV